MGVRAILISFTTGNTSLGESSINDFISEGASTEPTTKDNEAETVTDGGNSVEELPDNTNQDSDESIQGPSKDESNEDKPQEETSEPPMESPDEESNGEELSNELTEEIPEDELLTEQIVEPDNLFFTKNFSDYTVIEGLLLLIFVILLFKFCIDMTTKQLHWRMF